MDDNHDSLMLGLLEQARTHIETACPQTSVTVERHSGAGGFINWLLSISPRLVKDMDEIVISIYLDESVRSLRGDLSTAGGKILAAMPVLNLGAADDLSQQQEASLRDFVRAAASQAIEIANCEWPCSPD